MPITARARLGGGPAIGDRELLGELRRCARKLKRTPSASAFNEWLGHGGAQLICLRFGSWRAACEEAGLRPNERPVAPQWGRRGYSDEAIVAAYMRIRAVVGGPPTIREWQAEQRPGEITCHALRRRCGNSWVAFLREMEELLPAEDDLADAAAANAGGAADLGVREATVGGRA